MSILSELNAEPQPPAFAEVLGVFPKSNVARMLGISQSYWCLLRQGNRDAGPKLQKKIDSLVEQVQAEQQAINA